VRRSHQSAVPALTLMRGARPGQLGSIDSEYPSFPDSGRVVPTPRAFDLTDSRRIVTGYLLPALTIAFYDSHSCCGTSDRPHTNRRTTLGSGPLGRSSDPTESGPGYPPPGEARRAAGGAHWQAVSTPWQAARQLSQSPCQFPDWLTGRQCPGQNRATRISTESVPRELHRP
jgi:hypothetical protein